MGGGLPQDGQVQAVLTCQGDIEDPDFPERCQRMFDRLSQVLENGECQTIGHFMILTRVPLQKS